MYEMALRRVQGCEKYVACRCIDLCLSRNSLILAIIVFDKSMDDVGLFEN